MMSENMSITSNLLTRNITKFIPSPLFGASNNSDTLPDASQLLQLTLRRNKRHLEETNNFDNKINYNNNKTELAVGVGADDVAAVTELIAFKLNACVDLDVVEAAEKSNKAIAYNVANSYKKHALAAFVLDNTEQYRWKSPLPSQEFTSPTKSSNNNNNNNNNNNTARQTNKKRKRNHLIHRANAVETPCLPAIILKNQ